MELLFVTVIGACLGLIVRYTMPNRGTYGLLLLPAISAAATAITWVALLWAGQTFDGTWIWVASLAAAVIAPVVAAALLPRRRAEADAQLFVQIPGGTASAARPSAPTSTSCAPSAESSTVGSDSGWISTGASRPVLRHPGSAATH